PSPLKSPVPAIVHGLGIEPGEPMPITAVPLSSHTATWPLVLSHRTSPLPSPLKSPVPATVQVAAPVPGEPPPTTVLPFISQITSCPPVLRQRMSAKPSPSKSRWPTIDQLLAAEPGEPPAHAVVPLIIHVATWPLVCRQRMSLIHSPLKSCVAVRGAALGRTNTHAAPALPLSPVPPTTALLPSAESAAEKPCLDAPLAPLPTSLPPCWVHTPPLRVNTQRAPTELLSPGPPTMAVLPSAETATEEPWVAPPVAPVPTS